MKKIFKNQTIVITGGTGSLGQVLTKRLLSSKEDRPKKIIIFSRDEAKQHYMRLTYQQRKIATDEVIYNNFRELLEFRIGDVRDYHSVVSVLRGADIVISAAALKQVPSCEYFPEQAVKTNILGPNNIIQAVKEHAPQIHTVVGVSTDKACKPINVMGMTKALQERIFISANILVPSTRFICVRYGNVLASRGSVIPLFLEQIKHGGPVTITTKDMTRFMLSLEDAVDTIYEAINYAARGETYIPQAPSARMVDLAQALIGDLKISLTYTGIRPGEKTHEILISEEELWRTISRRTYYVIKSLLPELNTISSIQPALTQEYSSARSPMTIAAIKQLLLKNQLTIKDYKNDETELLK